MDASASLAAQLEPHRRMLWSVCYRMTGVAADADELVQETFLRALSSPPEDQARDIAPWLVRVAVNASRDLLRKRKQAVYRGPWLPAPIEDEAWMDASASPAARYSTRESVSYAFMLALEALSPTQRAIVMLRDVLDYSVEETARALELSESNVKTSHHRARAALAEYDEERPPLDEAHRAVAQGAMARFFAHVALEDVAGLERMLRADVVGTNDGAGEFFAAQRPIYTPERVARFYTRVGQKSALTSSRITVLSGLPALIATSYPYAHGISPRSVTLFDVDTAGAIRRVFTLVASRKIEHLFAARAS